MVDRDSRLKAAILRQNVREIDAKVQAIHAEQRLFRRYKFDLDVQEIQLSALRDERADLVGQLQSTRWSAAGNRDRSSGLRSWLVLPFALGALAIQAVHPKRRRLRGAYPPNSTLSLKPARGQSAS